MGLGSSEARGTPSTGRAPPPSRVRLPFTCPRRARPGEGQVCLGTMLRCLNYGVNTFFPPPSHRPAFLRPGLALVTRQPRHRRAPTLRAGMGLRLLTPPFLQQK